MWPFKSAGVAGTKLKPEPEPIAFRADDIPMRRARKIWQAIGFANDRFGSIPQIAGYLAMYRDWDRAAAENNVDYMAVVEGDEPSLPHAGEPQ